MKITDSLMDELVQVFKVAWHDADAAGQEGSRVRNGLKHVLNHLEQVAPEPVPTRLTVLLEELLSNTETDSLVTVNHVKNAASEIAIYLTAPVAAAAGLGGGTSHDHSDS